LAAPGWLAATAGLAALPCASFPPKPSCSTMVPLVVGLFARRQRIGAGAAGTWALLSRVGSFTGRSFRFELAKFLRTIHKLLVLSARSLPGPGIPGMSKSAAAT
jgi:hypothetical protein